MTASGPISQMTILVKLVHFGTTQDRDQTISFVAGLLASHRKLNKIPAEFI